MLYTPMEAGRMTAIAQPKLLYNMQSWFFLKYIYIVFKEESSKPEYWENLEVLILMLFAFPSDNNASFQFKKRQCSLIWKKFFRRDWLPLIKLLVSSLAWKVQKEENHWSIYCREKTSVYLKEDCLNSSVFLEITAKHTFRLSFCTFLLLI